MRIKFIVLVLLIFTLTLTGCREAADNRLPIEAGDFQEMFADWAIVQEWDGSYIASGPSDNSKPTIRFKVFANENDAILGATHFLNTDLPNAQHIINAPKRGNYYIRYSYNSSMYFIIVRIGNTVLTSMGMIPHLSVLQPILCDIGYWYE